MSGRRGAGSGRAARTGRACRLAAGLLLLGAGTALPGTALAEVLVSNLRQSGVKGESLGIHDFAVRFTTGPGASGYKITSIWVEFGVQEGGTAAVPTVRLFSGSPTGTELAEFTGPTVLQGNRTTERFTPNVTVTLANQTDYWVRVAYEGTGAGEDASLVLTRDGGEDASSNPGWSIADRVLQRAAGSTGSFRRYTDVEFPLTKWAGRIRVDGNVRPDNSPATGKPAISGTARVGQLLTADRGTIADDNGVPDVFEYQWFRVVGGADTEIPGATEKTYRLTDDEEGRQLRVALSFVDNDGYPEGPLASDPYPTGATVEPQQRNYPATGKPAISGIARVGQTLTADRGTVDDRNGMPDVFEYQWIRVVGGTDRDIPGATERTYALTADDEGNKLRVALSFVDNDGYPEGPLASDPYPTIGNVDPRPANIPATGKPTISGTARVGQVLTADRGTVDDANGMPDSFDYQWFRVDGQTETEIPGATGMTYSLTADDQDKQFRVTLSFVDNDGYPEARTSDPYPAGDGVDPPPPNSPATGKPVISGTARVGQVLTADRGTIADANGVPDVFEYQWIRVDGDSETEIAGATEKTYRLTAADQDKQLRVTLSFVDNDGYPEARTSDPYPAGDDVDPPPANSPATGKPVISGTARVGQVLTADRGTIEDANGVPDVFDYQWIRVDGESETEIAGANGMTYRLTAADEGKQFRVTLSFVDNDGYPEGPLASDPYPTIGNVAPRPANSPATGKPVISGIAQVGRVLTADRGTIEDANGVPDSFDYQWIRVDGQSETEIAGANGMTYRLTAADEGKQFRVTLSFVDNDGYPEARTSDPYPSDSAVLPAVDEVYGGDAIPNGWLARFARTVGAQAVDAIEARLAAPRRPGLAGSVAGQSVSGPADAAPGERSPALADRSGGAVFGSRTVSGREALAATAFAFGRDGADGGGAAFWGRGTATRFEGRKLGAVFDGEVSNAMLGADGSWGRALAGIVVSLARGQGGYRAPADSGAAEARLATVFPYGRYTLSERITLWGMAGYGAGSMTLTPEARETMRPDIDFGMVAVGARGVLVDGGEDGPTVAAKTDAMAVRARADRVPALTETEAEVTRLRFGLEAERRFALGGAAVLTPALSLGLRRDGGDAETGTGADIGAGLALSDPARGLSAEVRARGLLTHEAGGFRERGLSAELSWEAAPEDERGLSLSLAQTLGGPAEGGAEALLARPAPAGIGPDDAEGDLARRRFEARLGYGFAVWGARWTARPELGLGLSDRQRELRLGGRLFERAATGLAVTLAVDGARRERVDGTAGAEHELGLALGWRLAAPRDGSAAFEMRIEAARRDVPRDNAIGLAAAARW